MRLLILLILYSPIWHVPLGGPCRVGRIGQRPSFADDFLKEVFLAKESGEYRSVVGHYVWHSSLLVYLTATQAVWLDPSSYFSNFLWYLCRLSSSEVGYVCQLQEESSAADWAFLPLQGNLEWVRGMLRASSCGSIISCTLSCVKFID